ELVLHRVAFGVVALGHLVVPADRHHRVLVRDDGGLRRGVGAHPDLHADLGAAAHAVLDVDGDVVNAGDGGVAADDARGRVEAQARRQFAEAISERVAVGIGERRQLVPVGVDVADHPGRRRWQGAGRLRALVAGARGQAQRGGAAGAAGVGGGEDDVVELARRRAQR
ncbi:hypothetical protein CATMIT_01941, partial [Catenibacterium mitsuokai DSM 15897]